MNTKLSTLERILKDLRAEPLVDVSNYEGGIPPDELPADQWTPEQKAMVFRESEKTLVREIAKLKAQG